MEVARGRERDSVAFLERALMGRTVNGSTHETCM